MSETAVRSPASRRSRQPAWMRHFDWSDIVLLVVAVLFLLSILAAGLLTPYAPADITGPAQSAPNAAHLLGTDQLGRDVLTRTFWGGRQTLVMAVGSTGLAAVIGVPLGMIAGYFGRWQAAVTMRLMDVLLAFPGLLFALIVITIAGAGVPQTVLAVGIAFVPVFARLVHAVTQRVRTEEYIAAAQVVGCGPWRILGRHVLPVLGSQVIVVVSSALGWTALLCAAPLPWLRVQPPTAEWGADLSSGVQYLSQAWWIALGPGIALSLTILLSNFLGDLFAKVLDAQPVASPETAVVQ